MRFSYFNCEATSVIYHVDMLYIGLPKYGEATREGEATERPACVTALWQQQSGNKSGHFIFYWEGVITP